MAHNPTKVSAVFLAENPVETSFSLYQLSDLYLYINHHER